MFQENIEDLVKSIQVYLLKNADIMVVATEEMKNQDAINQGLVIILINKEMVLVKEEGMERV